MDAMTISQALRKISKLKGTLKEQLERAQSSVVYTTDNAPAFSFTSSWEQAEAARDALIALETALRVTNAVTKFDFKGKPMTLSEATCRLQEIKGTISWVKGLRTQAQAERTEKEYVSITYNSDKAIEKITVTKCDLPEAKRAEWVKREQDQFDALNDAVEAVNHRTTLVG
jgi:hypothetical protein